MLFPMILHLSSVNLRLMSSKPLLIGLAFSSQAVLIFKLMFSNPRFHGKNPELERFHLVLPLVWIPRHVSLLLVLTPTKKKKSLHGTWTVGHSLLFLKHINTHI